MSGLLIMPTHLVVLLTFALVPITARAQEAMSIESIAEANFGKETYCETGKWGTGGDPKYGTPFSRCAHSDGRFKVVDHVGLPHQDVLWSDSRKYYRHAPAANHYRESPLDDDFLRSWPANRSELYPIYLSRLFNRYSPNGPPRTSTRYFQSYKASGALSTPQLSAFERHDDENHTHSERLWVRNADKMIVRYEGLSNGVVLQFVEITSQKVDAALTDADLSHDVPRFTRFSLKNDPAVFVIGFFVAAGVGGTALWWWLFSRAASVQDVVRKRRLMWRVQLWASIGVAIVLACLAALAAVGGGHGGLVIVFVLAMYCAVGFALAACFTLVSYPVEWLLSRVARGAERHGG